MKIQKVIEAVYDLGYDRGYGAAEDMINPDRDRLLYELTEMTGIRDKAVSQLKAAEERAGRLSAELENGDEMQRVMATELQDLRNYRENRERRDAQIEKDNEARLEQRMEAYEVMRDALDVSMEKGTVSLTTVRDLMDHLKEQL